MPKPVFVRLPDSVHQNLLIKKPESLTLSTFCALLLEQAVDTPVTLAERAEASEASTSTSKCIHIDLEEEFKNKTINQLAVKSPKKASKSRVRPNYTSEFVAFWNEYQRAPIKANAQSKNKAFDAWREAVKLEAPERLLEIGRAHV